ncbi:hypothetical protein LOAG_16920 [Loa loa]|uniref:Uncharacterized protein n=1 Tax=Loa loa TaxID=7209 RepID=A0A1S0UKW3_LOALO|nr:hypothetical protein LOAG_16920 [Loa loa]EJD76066.1 hypothetical protein LOAG_16920 [Loa loa]
MLDNANNGRPECHSALIAHELSQLNIDIVALSEELASWLKSPSLLNSKIRRQIIPITPPTTQQATSSLMLQFCKLTLWKKKKQILYQSMPFYPKGSFI